MNQQVNLYTDELRPRREPIQASVAVLAVLVALTVVVLGAVYARYDHASQQAVLNDLNADIGGLESRVAMLTIEVESQRVDPDVARAVDEIANSIGQRQRLLAEVERLVGSGGTGFSPFMTAMARQVPDGVWLTGFRVDLANEQIQLSGRTRTGDKVPVYLERLGNEAVFSGRQFARFNLERHESGQWIDFRVATERVSGDES